MSKKLSEKTFDWLKKNLGYTGSQYMSRGEAAAGLDKAKDDKDDGWGWLKVVGSTAVGVGKATGDDPTEGMGEGVGGGILSPVVPGFRPLFYVNP